MGPVFAIVFSVICRYLGPFTVLEGTELPSKHCKPRIVHSKFRQCVYHSRSGKSEIQ
jgi:hypothetical protein